MKKKINHIIKKLVFYDSLKKYTTFKYSRERDKYSLLRKLGYLKYFLFKKVVDIGYIGYGRKKNKIVPWAIGIDRNTPGYDGVNLNELSNILLSLGCQEAINLDGGGSTSMVVSNQLLVRPGDNGVERPVVSAVLIKKK